MQLYNQRHAFDRVQRRANPTRSTLHGGWLLFAVRCHNTERCKYNYIVSSITNCQSKMSKKHMEPFKLTSTLHAEAAYGTFLENIYFTC